MLDVIRSKSLVSAFVEKLPVPFMSEIYLYTCKIAGTSYAAGAVDLLENVEEGSPLLLLREPKNPFDAMAILVMRIQGEKFKYIPRGENSIFARLLDGGKLLQAKLVDVSRKSEQYAVATIDIYLKY